jgi:hypothetical protein
LQHSQADTQEGYDQDEFSPKREALLLAKLRHFKSITDRRRA